MLFRAGWWASALFTFLFAGLAADCARMCIKGHGAMSMDCWIASHSGLACDNGMLIVLITATMFSALLTLIMWLSAAARA